MSPVLSAYQATGEYNPRVRSGWTIAAVVALAGVSTLWLFSGRERLTKSTKHVEVVQEDDLFGDMEKRIELRRGPILGYYVGLDAVAGVAAAVGLISAGRAIVRRRRARRKGVAP